MSENIVEALLEADEDELNVKELTGISDRVLAQQKARLLPLAIDRKEKYLGGRCRKTGEFTNPMGETFVFGKFKSGSGGGRDTLVTLLYLNPKSGWQMEAEELRKQEGEDYKELYTGPKAPEYLPLGTISHATMREEDLIPAFIDALDAVDRHEAEVLRSEYVFVDKSDPEFCWERVARALEKHTPPYAYFGSHPGDGSDFGVWVNEEGIEDALKDENEMRAVQQGQEILHSSKYVVVIDASGDYRTLLDGTTGQEIWSI